MRIKDVNVIRPQIHKTLHDSSVAIRDLIRIIVENDLFLSDYDHDLVNTASSLAVTASELAVITRVRGNHEL